MQKYIYAKKLLKNAKYIYCDNPNPSSILRPSFPAETKAKTIEAHKYVSLPPAGRKGTKTDVSILNWSKSLRFPY